ncbi:MAG: TonB-dependent receptor [Methylobacter sp.]|nr:MAG: TonB-dependent receptor [Methylobacter sp.]
MRSLIVTVILIALSSQVEADNFNAEDLTNLSIEQLLNVDVISASRLGQKTSRAPSSVSVLTAADIRTFGWRTLSEALNAMRGLFTANDRNYSYLGVRGFIHPNDYNSRVLFMIDGQRMNENIFDGGYMAQEFMLDMDLVERIEFMPGSGSSIYGANAFSGLINIVTKTGKAVNGAQLAGEVGSFDTYKGRASYGKKLANGADILFSASHYDSDGVTNLYFPEFDKPSTNNGIAHNMDAERADRLFGRIQFEEFTLMGGFVDRFKRVPTASFEGIFNDPDFYTVDRQFFGNLKYNKALTDKTSLQLKGFSQGYEYSADQAYDNNGRVLNHDMASGRWWGGDAQLTSTFFDKHRLMLGLEYQYDWRQRMFNYDINPYAVYQDSNRSGHRVELYAQDDIQVLDDVIFSVGMRLDYHHMLKNLQLNPRLGLIWNPLESASFKLLYASTFRAPNVWERDYNYSGSNTANPNNNEERIKSYESIVEWHSTTGLKLIGDFFYNDISQLLEQYCDPDYGAYGPFMNIGHHYHAIGVEFEAEQRWDSGRFFKASHTYSRLTDVHESNIWAHASPQNIFKLHYAEPLFNNFAKLGVENIYIGERKALQGGTADAYDLVNLNLSSDRIMRGLVVSFGVYDLFDTRAQMLGGTGPADITQNILPMNGREFRLKLQVTF